jgi:hypothetical protein
MGAPSAHFAEAVACYTHVGVRRGLHTLPERPAPPSFLNVYTATDFSALPLPFVPPAIVTARRGSEACAQSSSHRALNPIELFYEIRGFVSKLPYDRLLDVLFRRGAWVEKSLAAAKLYSPLQYLVPGNTPWGGEGPFLRLHRTRAMQHAGYGLPRRPQAVEKLPWCPLSPQIEYQTRCFWGVSSAICDRYRLNGDFFNKLTPSTHSGE